MARADSDVLVLPLNFYGTPGLLDMPGAHMSADGTISLGISNALNFQQRFNFTFQALPWLEGSFRYFATPGFHNNKIYYDRSFGLKIRLQDETEDWPDISVGALDIVGTSVVAGEYLVASKHFGPFDATLGLGWGRLASTGMFKNPFAYLAPGFARRTDIQGLAGTGQVQFGQFFRGPDASLFGGAIWHTPIDGLSLIGEYSSDDYHGETELGAHIHVRSQFNAGLSYQYNNALQFTGAWFYGTTAMLQMSFSIQPKTDFPYPRLGQQPLVAMIRSEETLEALNRKSQQNPPTIVSTEMDGRNMIVLTRGRAVGAISCESFADLARRAGTRGVQQLAIYDVGDSHGRVQFCPATNGSQVAALQLSSLTDSSDPLDNDDVVAAARSKAIALAKSQGLGIYAIRFDGTEAEVAFANYHYRNETEAYGRLVRVLLASVPDDIETFRLISMVNGIPAQEIVLSRGALERTLLVQGGSPELLPLTEFVQPPHSPDILDEGTMEYPRFDWAILPEYNQSLFDPDKPYRIQILAGIRGGVEFVRGLRLDAEVQANIFDTFSNLRPSNSVLPHVRTDFNKYFDQGKNGIANLEGSYRTTVAPGLFAELKAGYLESMFAGAGGEVLWRPEGMRFAVGVSAYEVWQRGFDRLFDLQKYHVLTGHVSLYYELPYYGLNAELHAGRYLAGDYGATFVLSRLFDTGVEVGVFATITNVPFAKFGEGSFDKGITMHIPMDWMVPVNSQSAFDLNLRPVNRDGGQMLNGLPSLYDETRRTGYGQILQHFDEVVSP